jgi:MscS family membrane protein
VTGARRFAVALVFWLGAATASPCQVPGVGKRAAAVPPEPAAVDSTPSTEQPAVDSLGEGNPRGALYRYLMDARNARWSDAAGALDLSGIAQDQRAVQGPLLARQLKVVLDRTIWFDFDKISDRPNGTITEGIPDDVERIGTIETASGPVDLTMRRVADPEAGGRPVWKFSPVLIERLPALYEEFRYGWIGEHAPDALHTMGPTNLEKWQVLGLLALVVFAWVSSWLVARGVLSVVRPIAARTRTHVDNRLLATLPRPVRWTIALAIIWAFLPALDFSISASAWTRRGLVAFGFVTFMLYVAAAAEAIAQAARERFVRDGQRSGAGVVNVAIRMVKILLVIIAVTVLLQFFGFNVTAIFAGLGIGGIAVALAAQKTIENLLGGLTLMADKPVRIGDYCRFGTQEGWVEDVGLRSTRVRTLARTVISVPNAEFSNVQIENLTERDRIRFFTTLNLRYETTPDQMRHVLAGLRTLFLAHPKVGSEMLRVRLAHFGASSLDIEINSYVMTADTDEFQAVREDLLLRIMDIVAGAGTGFAFPSQTLYMARDHGLDEGQTRRAEEATRALRAQGKLPFPDFTFEESQSIADTLDYPPKGSSSARVQNP